MVGGRLGGGGGGVLVCRGLACGVKYFWGLVLLLNIYLLPLCHNIKN